VNRSTLRRLAPVAAVLAAASSLAGAVAAKPPPKASGPSIGFTQPIYVDTTLAGGEPIVMANPLRGTLVYTSHEGTTHLYRNGIESSPFGDFQFVSNYCNQVNIWTSTDGGATWQRDHYLDSAVPCPASPPQGEGFSDPDLTMDDGGRMYNTGIDLVNDAVFSSGDGGRTWDKGTSFCHDGDRPWLAGGKPDEVFLASNTEEGSPSHEIFQSTDGGNSCSLSGISDGGSLAGHGSYTGDGKIYADSTRDRLIEPEVFDDGLGVGTWTRGAAAFTPHFAVQTSLFSHWPAIALDSGNNVYLVWDTNDPSTSPNKVQYVYSKDFGSTWSAPITVAAPSNARVFWPWISAGDAGKISIVWYQTNPGELVDLDSTAAHIQIYEETVTEANTAKPTVYGPVNAAGRTIHVGSVCQGGTTCVATGQDRRLGDFFTNALDARGCVLIASGDTRMTDPLTGAEFPTARPIFMRQNVGPALRGNGTCS
jgi:hypothetical protein